MDITKLPSFVNHPTMLIIGATVATVCSIPLVLKKCRETLNFFNTTHSDLSRIKEILDGGYLDDSLRDSLVKEYNDLARNHAYGVKFSPHKYQEYEHLVSAKEDITWKDLYRERSYIAQGEKGQYFILPPNVFQKVWHYICVTAVLILFGMAIVSLLLGVWSTIDGAYPLNIKFYGMAVTYLFLMGYIIFLGEGYRHRVVLMHKFKAKKDEPDSTA